MTKIKRQTIYMLLLGALCLSYSFFTKHFFYSHEGLIDFLKGFGTAMMIGAVIVQAKKGDVSRKVRSW